MTAPALTFAAPGDSIGLKFLQEDAQTAADVAGWFADFIDGAERTLDIAIYDCHLAADPARIIATALAAARARGVAIRVVTDGGDRRGDVDPLDTRERARRQPSRLDELGLPPDLQRTVLGANQLMHHKYLVADQRSIWTGSLNLSDDGFRRMDNLVITLASERLARWYHRDFERLWRTRSIAWQGGEATKPALLRYAGAPACVDVDFSPAQGQQINRRIAHRVAAAHQRIVVCSKLVTSSRILDALIGQLDRGRVEITGIVDGAQMRGVIDQWETRPELHWKIDAVERLLRETGIVQKQSTPWRRGGSHNFLHHKTIVCDGTVITGSYNLSHAAQTNAENILVIESQALAAEVVAEVTRLKARYGATTA
jgi:phosphatidylserine/phosphatidylglycerophosphate/cardiolipin synthase-like enzyme